MTLPRHVNCSTSSSSSPQIATAWYSFSSQDPYNFLGFFCCCLFSVLFFTDVIYFVDFLSDVFDLMKPKGKVVCEIQIFKLYPLDIIIRLYQAAFLNVYAFDKLPMIWCLLQRLFNSLLQCKINQLIQSESCSTSQHRKQMLYLVSAPAREDS